MQEAIRCGLVTLVGRPSVGKSSLINRLIGHKVSITSPRPQTTRHRLYGIRNRDDAQIVFVDTPGLHPAAGRKINKYLNRTARGSLEGIDCIVFVISATGWTPQDEYVLKLLDNKDCPVLLCINKIDKLKDKTVLLPMIESLQEKRSFAAIVPVSARTRENLPRLEQAILELLPVQPPLFPREQITDRSERFIAAELVREQLFRATRQEVPYSIAVVVEEFKRERKKLFISAVIWVEKEGQKIIIIGKGGSGLKMIGQRARREMEKIFGGKVRLELWVKVRADWPDSERDLHAFGYDLER